MPTERPTRHLARFLFTRLLALAFLAFFLTTLIQFPGLFGSRGLLPAGDMTAEAARLLPEAWKRFWIFPTFCWVSPSDFSIRLQCVLGAAAALAAFLGVAPGLLAAACWALALSLAQAGQDFFRLPFDNLLLECGLLAAVALPWRGFRFYPADGPETPSHRLGGALFILLLFKVYFLPGLGHLCLGDPAWPTLEAVSFRLWTDPIPNALGLWLARLPHPFLQILAGLVLALECIAPPLLILRQTRRFAFFPLTLLSLGTAALGSPGSGFLLFSIGLWSLEDPSFPASWRNRGTRPQGGPSDLSPFHAWTLRLYALPAFVTFLGFLFGLFQVQPFGAPGTWVYRSVYSLRSFNSYLPPGPVWTKRLELSLEGTQDGTTWKEYPFRAKPGDPARGAGWFPHFTSRLDDRMAYAARGDCQDSPFLAQLCADLLDNLPPVLSLMGTNPFPDKPPAVVRLRRWEYHLPTPRERSGTKDFWIREFKDDFCPELRKPK